LQERDVTRRRQALPRLALRPRASNCYRFGSSGRGQWSTSNPGHNEPTYKSYWEIPGGVVEAGESPYAAAVRELEEELGLAVQPGRLLVTDWVPPAPERTEGLMLVFDGGIVTPEQIEQIRLPAGDLSGGRRHRRLNPGERDQTRPIGSAKWTRLRYQKSRWNSPSCHPSLPRASA
jgi:8-oxo-dGTP pyrophosphatase MutT (NUDIX family)